MTPARKTPTARPHTARKTTKTTTSPRQIPPDVKALAHQDVPTATATLRRLARSKTVWYAIVMLALAGASALTVRQSLTEHGLRGMGDVTIAALRRLGTKIRAARPDALRRLGAAREDELKRLADCLLAMVASGDMKSVDAIRALGGAFKPTNDKTMALRLLTDLTREVEKKSTTWWRFF